MHCLCSYHTQSLYKEVVMQIGWDTIATHAENELQVEDILVGPKTSSSMCCSHVCSEIHTHLFVLNECLMLQGIHSVCGHFHNDTLWKTPFLSLLFVGFYAYCLLSSFQCGLRWGLMLC